MCVYFYTTALNTKINSFSGVNMLSCTLTPLFNHFEFFHVEWMFSSNICERFLWNPIVLTVIVFGSLYKAQKIGALAV